MQTAFHPFRKIFLILGILSLCIPTFAATDEFYPAKVKDISDRAYEPALIELIDNAKLSIIMSMYILKPIKPGPVYLLVKDLEEALARGVSVEIYLNTHPDFSEIISDVITPPLKELIKKGARIYKSSPNLRLHDKLIIIDERYVVEGSMNWSVSAIKSNNESAVLIDSPELAKAKIVRVRRLVLEGDNGRDKPRPDRPKGLTPLAPGAIVSVSKELMTNACYLPDMTTNSSVHNMNVYLLLLAESTRIGKKEFFVPLEEMGVSMGLNPVWSDNMLRRLTIRRLRALQDKYGLLKVNFGRGKDAWVELKELEGPTFSVKGEFFDPKKMTPEGTSVKFVRLITAFLESEGTSIDDISVKDLANRFGICSNAIRKGKRVIAGEDIGTY